MRISVCEFLRIVTNRNWYFYKQGHWVSEGLEYDVKRDEDGELRQYRGNRYIRTLHYFEGLPSNEVRRRNQKKRH